MHMYKGVVDFIVTFKYFQKSPPSTVINKLTSGSEVHGLYN